jgi:hypothetical protein
VSAGVLIGNVSSSPRKWIIYKRLIKTTAFYALKTQEGFKLTDLMSARVIDVRLNNKASNGEVNFRDEIVKGLSRPVGQKILSQILLYDEEGIRFFDDITTAANDYYLFHAEETLLKRHADDIVQVMHDKEDEGAILLELGAG